MLKLLEAEWVRYREAEHEGARLAEKLGVAPADPHRLGSRMQVEEELRRAFFAGALAVFRVVQATGVHTILAQLDAELSAYSDAELRALAARLTEEAGFYRPVEGSKNAK